MAEKVLIFGKDAWPYTVKAREAYEKDGKAVDYFNVLSKSDKLTEMLKYTNGSREVPVIVEGDKVTAGFGGSWGV